jgi:hypothetical protein
VTLPSPINNGLDCPLRYTTWQELRKELQQGQMFETSTEARRLVHCSLQETHFSGDNIQSNLVIERIVAPSCMLSLTSQFDTSQTTPTLHVAFKTAMFVFGSPRRLFPVFDVASSLMGSGENITTQQVNGNVIEELLGEGSIHDEIAEAFLQYAQNQASTPTNSPVNSPSSSSTIDEDTLVTFADDCTLTRLFHGISANLVALSLARRIQPDESRATCLDYAELCSNIIAALRGSADSKNDLLVVLRFDSTHFEDNCLSPEKFTIQLEHIYHLYKL